MSAAAAAGGIDLSGVPWAALGAAAAGALLVCAALLGAAVWLARSEGRAAAAVRAAAGAEGPATHIHTRRDGSVTVHRHRGGGAAHSHTRRSQRSRLLPWA